MLRLVMAAVVVAAMSLPAEAQVVYLKDGRRIEGTLAIEDARMTIAKPDGTQETVRYEEVQGVSLDGVDLYPSPKAALPPWVTWTVAGANLVAVATAIYLVMRPTPTKP